MSSHDLLVLWTQIASLLLSARLLGALANRIGQPAVAGELTAGLLLGPSVLGHAYPAGFNWLFPKGGASTPLTALTAISLVGLLVAIGAETDLPLIRRLGRAAVSVAAVSLAVPLAAGAVLALVLPRSLMAAHAGIAPFVIVVAGAVGVTSLPVIAKIVSDLGLLRRNVGQMAIAAGTAHDAVGFVLVALVTGLAGASGGSAGRVVVALIGVAGVSAVILTAGQRVFDHSLRRVRQDGPNVAGSLTVCVVGAVAAAAAMQAFGVEGALGAFVAGVALGRSRFQVGRAVSVLNTMTTTIFAPLYFSTAGLKVDLGVLGRASVALSFAAIVAVAVTAKFAGVLLGGVLARLHRREMVALGVGLNGRGALQVVLATAGLAAGVLTTASYTLIILLSVVTSLAVPPLLRLTLSGWAGTDEEQERLGREEQLERNVVVRGQRLLLASRGSRSSVVAAEILAAVWPGETAVTVLSIGDTRAEEVSPAVQAILDVLGERPVEHRRLRSDQVAAEILAEANLGYGAIALGAADEPEGGHLLSPVLDELLMRSPLPLIIVRRPRLSGAAMPGAFQKVLVPVTGTPPSRAGLEVACNLSLAVGTRVVLAHVVTRSDSDSRTESVLAAAGNAGGARPAPPPAPPRRELVAADGGAQVVLRSAWDTAIDMGVEPEVVLRHGHSAGEQILGAAGEVGADVVALGATVRQVEDHPFLGHTVEQVLARFDGTVVVVALPEHASRLGSAIAEAAG